jgi:choline trimethylamine-lyase
MEKIRVLSNRTNNRMATLIKGYENSEPHVCIKRAKAVTESNKENIGATPITKKAKAFRKICTTVPVNIFEAELIVGASGTYRRSASVSPEISWKWIEEEIDTISERSQDPYQIGEKEIESLKNEILPYWEGKSIEEAFLKRLPNETAKIIVDTGVVDNDSKWRCAVGEITPDYQDILFKKGYCGIIQDAKEKIKTLDKTLPQDIEKADFYSAVIECGLGMIELNLRYAKKADEMALSEENQQRKHELITIANNCRQVPAHPPENFWQAIQMLWSVQLGNLLFENAVALNIGRFDQFMFPFYNQDVEKGDLDKECAQELISCLWIKLSEWIWFVSKNTASFFAGYSAFQNLTVGGKTQNGIDGTNDLTYMCMNATKEVKTHQPSLSVRVSPDSPDEFLFGICNLVKEGHGFPAIHNDRVGTQMLLGVGLSPEDALDWSNCGCVVPHSRKISEWTSACSINLASGVEFVLNNGKSRITGERYGLDTGSLMTLDSFDIIKNNYFSQLSHLIKHAVIATLIAQNVQAELAPRPLFSSFTEGCMESGKDVTQGGALYNVGPVLTGVGIADTVNSLAAINYVIFKNKTVDLETLCQALADNWVGFEDLRKKALECPKFGNDDDEVDLLALEVSNFYQQEVRKYTDIYRNKFNSAFMGISNYIPAGKAVGATPCGRKSQDPLTEGCSPHAGTDQISPTAVMKSIAKIDHSRHSGGTLLNIKLSPDTLKTRNDVLKLTHLIRGYLELDAFHIQFNVFDKNTLFKAQKAPHDYKHLLIRVAGYTANFVTLSREVQDAIIERTSYSTI